MEDHRNEIVQNQPVITRSERKLPRNKYTVLGVIESNGQIVRNESGQTKHKEFKGPYIPLEQRPKRTVPPADRHNDFDNTNEDFFEKNSEKLWTFGWVVAALASIWAIFGRK